MSQGTAGTNNRSGIIGALINNEYRIIKKLGGGSFGEIYLGVGGDGRKVAMKFEAHGTRCPQLRHEYKVYRELNNCMGFGTVSFFGIHQNYNVMVMDLLGPSLEDLFVQCDRHFSLKTVLQLADQILERINDMHYNHLVHRDVKPANFVMGLGNQTVFSIDFGLSSRYRHPRTLQHIPYREGRSLTGTPRFASINNHLGLEQSRRDDLESVGYVLIYFLKGSLPWQGLKARSARKKYKMILEKKQAISIQQLCEGLPQQFVEYLAYCRSLKFDTKPNILYLRGLFRELYTSCEYGRNSIGKLNWDWTKDEEEEMKTVEPVASLTEQGQSANGNSSPCEVTQHATVGSPMRSSALNLGAFSNGEAMLGLMPKAHSTKPLPHRYTSSMLEGAVMQSDTNNNNTENYDMYRTAQGKKIESRADMNTAPDMMQEGSNNTSHKKSREMFGRWAVSLKPRGFRNFFSRRRNNQFKNAGQNVGDSQPRSNIQVQATGSDNNNNRRTVEGSQIMRFRSTNDIRENNKKSQGSDAWFRSTKEGVDRPETPQDSSPHLKTKSGWWARENSHSSDRRNKFDSTGGESAERRSGKKSQFSKVKMISRKHLMKSSNGG